MNELLKVFLSLSLSGTLLILILMLCKPLFKRKLSKQWQYYIWIIVIARLLLPIAPETSLMGNIFQAIDNISIRTEINPQTEQNGSVLPEMDYTPNGVPAGDPGGSNAEQPESEVRPQQDMLNIALQNIWLVWLIVAIALFIRKITVYQSFVKYVKAGRTEISDIALWERFGKLVEQSGVKKTVGIYTNSLISSPILIGFFRPCIILPSTELSETDFQYTILHELTHYKRLDMFYKWLAQITICLHWFNPFVYLMGHEINRACELACDEAVIKNLDTDGQRAYGDTLLNALGAGGSYKNSLASVTLTENKILLKERLDAIMSYKKKSMLAVGASVLLTCFLLCGFAFTGAYAAGQSPSPAVENRLTSDNETGAGQATSYVIECASENITIIQEGAEFKFEVDPASQNNYRLRDNTNIAMGDRNYRYNKWDVIFERVDRLSTTERFSTDVIITIPMIDEAQELLLITNSGDIHVENLINVTITAESESGHIYIADTGTEYITVKSDTGNIELLNITSKTDIDIRSDSGTVLVQLGNSNSLYAVKIDTDIKANITINGRNYNGGDFIISNGGAQTISIKGENNTFTLSNIPLYNNETANMLNGSSVEQDGQNGEVYWTEAEFLNFIQDQEQRYKALLASGNITQEEYNTFISTDKAILRDIQNGAKISKSATGSIDNGIGN